MTDNQSDTLPTPVKAYKDGVPLFNIITDGVSRDFKDDQIISEAAGSGFVITKDLIDAVRRDFHHRMVQSFNGGKSLGQIAHESRHDLYSGSMRFAENIKWDKLPAWQQREAEAMAQGVANHLVRDKATKVYVFVENDKLYVSSVPSDREWEDIEKESFEIPVPKGHSLEGARNIVANVLRNGGAPVDTSG